MTMFRPAARLMAGISACALMTFAAQAASEQGYYRWPTISGDTIIVSAEGDLWRGSASNGAAYRLTSHAGQEIEPALSPDGRRVAFLASYDSGPEVYVMDIAGGAPKQLSFDGLGIDVRGWTPDGRIMYSTGAVGRPDGRLLRLVDPDSGATEEVPLAWVRDASFNGDGKTLFFTRFGLESSGDHTKHYRGGLMAQLWRYDMGGKKEAVRLAADFGAPIRHPMWWRGRIYFISDKTGGGNIWSMAEDGGDIRQHTRFDGWDIRTPRLKDGKIAFQLGADIHVYDIAADAERLLPLKLVSDADGERLRWIDEPLQYLTNASFAPGGDYVALTARGKIALASLGPLRRVEFAIPDAARARNAVVGAEGKWVYAILDQGLRSEIWRYPLDGRGAAEQLTKDADAFRWGLFPSPYGKYLLHTDKEARLWLYDLDSGKNTQLDAVDGVESNPFSNFAWSADNAYLAYTRVNKRGISQVAVLDLKNKRKEIVTTGKYNSYAPAFARDGEWLYFLSDRHFDAQPSSPWGDRNMGPQFDKRTKIYALALDPDARFPFLPKDELMAAAKETAKEKDGGEAKAAATKLTFDGLAERLYEVPAAPGNYGDLQAGDGLLFMTDRDGSDQALKSLKIDAVKPEMEVFTPKLAEYALSADGKKLFYRLPGEAQQMYIVDAGAKAPGDLSTLMVRTGDWKIAIDPREEWRQMFLDSWRQHRDFSFDPAMRGLDWDAIRAKYQPLVARVRHRGELNDLLGQMSSEIAILHSQVRAYDYPEDDENGQPAALGAVFTAVEGGLKVTRILRSETDLPERRPPFAQPNVDVQEGDVITAVNGAPVRRQADLYAALLNKAGQQVALDVRRGKSAVHKAVVAPVSARGEYGLLYNDWVEGNREAVAKMGQGKIGYLHLAAMGAGDIESFARDFYEHYDKEGLIIDVRGNNGGNIDSWIIQALLRRIWGFWVLGGREQPFTNMQQTFRGHLAVLINESTYSDGETFAAGIKSLDLAPLIGTQTAGAGIWLSDQSRLSDNGMARVAEYPQFGLDGRWLIEGWGVEPDIRVENMPAATYRGQDAQLETAVDYLMKEIKEKPLPVLKPKPIPPVGQHGRDPK